jgi:hypothetical protein
MNVALHEFGKIMPNHFLDSVMTSIPTQLPDGAIHPYTPPSIEHYSGIERVCTKFIDSINGSVSYVEDFLIEMQNILMSDLFRALSQRIESLGIPTGG